MDEMEEGFTPCTMLNNTHNDNLDLNLKIGCGDYADEPITRDRDKDGLVLSPLKKEVEEEEKKGSGSELEERVKDSNADVIMGVDDNVGGENDKGSGYEFERSGRGRKRKQVEIPEKGNDAKNEDDEEKGGLILISNALDSVEGLDFSTPDRKVVERNRSGNVDRGKGKNNKGRKQRRKRKKVERPKEEDGVDIAGDEEKRESPLISNAVAAPNNSVISSKLEEERSGSENEECGGNADHGVDVDANTDTDIDVDADKGTSKLEKRQQGRKRRLVESSESNEDDGAGRKKVKEVSLDGVVSTTSTTDDEKVLDGGKCVGELMKNEFVQLENKRVEVGNEEGARSIGRTLKKRKGRRGRPPKASRKNGTSVVIENRKEKVRAPKKSNVISKAESVIKDSKSPKVQKKIWESGVINDETENIRRPKEGSDQPKDKGKGNRLTGHSHHAGKIITGNKLKKKKHKKEGQMGRREEQQLLRDQIITILKNAGWTIEHRPRQSREYLDAVYVDLEGKTYWSITLAYRTLKQKVEDGVADSKTISAFTPIPEEVLSKLFRVRKVKKEKGIKVKGQSEGGTKTKKGITGKKLLKKKKHSTKSMGSLKLKEKSSNRKMKGNTLHCERGNSEEPSHRGMPRSTRERKNRKTCSLLVRRSEEGSDPDIDGFMAHSGKCSLLSWMIDLGTIYHGGKVQYMNSGTTVVLLEGQITRDGIKCDCCNEILTIPKFESHSGCKLCQPFENIYLESGVSLLQCLVDSWSKLEESNHIGFRFQNIDGDDPNDDRCNICGDGGVLICCDGCPSTFHQSCLDIQKFPPGDWHCLYCSCKFCGTVAGKTSKRDDNHDEHFSELLICRLCEEKFHLPCIQGNDAIDVNCKYPSFCGRNCQKLFERLQVLLGVKHELDEGFSWTLLQRYDVSHDDSLTGAPLKVECNSKLAVALSIMDECFLPVVDERSGISMIHNVVYSCGSNFSRLNYSGFYTAVLERGDEIISAASIRIHGNQLAEMPFIGTRHMYRRQGMCRRLLNAIELALCSLDVEKLVIPAISELIQTWTSVFGFKHLDESKRKEIRHLSMIVFPGTNMLEKPLLKHQFMLGKMIVAADISDMKCSDGSNSYSNASPEDIIHHASGVNDESAALESGLPPDKIDGCPNVSSGSMTGLPHVETGDSNSRLNQQESKPSNQITSGAMNCEIKTTHKIEGSNDAVDCEQNGEVKCPKSDSSSLQGDSIQHSADMMTQCPNVDLVQEFQVADSNFLCQDTVATSSISSDANYKIQHLHNSHVLVVHTTVASHGRAQDGTNDSDAPSPNASDHNCSCQVNVIRTHESQDVVSKLLPSSGAFDYATTGSNSEAFCMIHGLRKSLEPRSGVENDDISGVSTSLSTCPPGVNHASFIEVNGNGVPEFKGQFAAAQTGSDSLDMACLPKKSMLSSKSSEQCESGSQVVPTSGAQLVSEPLSNSSSCPGVAHLVTTSSCNSCS